VLGDLEQQRRVAALLVGQARRDGQAVHEEVAGVHGDAEVEGLRVMR